MRRPCESTNSGKRRRTMEDKEMECPSSKHPLTEENSEKSEDLPEDEYQMLMDKLNMELRSTAPRSKKIKRLMKKTFSYRLNWIKTDRPCMAEILDVFPPLKESKQVWHCKFIIIIIELVLQGDTFVFRYSYIKNWSNVLTEIVL